MTRRVTGVAVWAVVMAGVLACVWAAALSPRGGAALAGVWLRPIVLVNTAAYGLATAALATGLGWCLAHAHARYRFRGRRVLHALWLAPLLMPSFTFALALVVLLGHNGVLARLSGWYGAPLYGAVGLTVAGTLARLPYAYLALVLAYRSIDERLLDAAADLGATPGQVLRRVLLPRLAPALVSVFTMVLADTVADLANPLVVGGGFDVLASRLYEAVTTESDFATAGAYALILTIPAVVAVAVGGLVQGRPPGTTPRLPARLATPGPAGRVLVALGWLVGACVVALFGAIGVGSVGLVVGGDGLAAYRDLLVGGQAVTLASSLLLACLVWPCVIVLAAALAVSAARGTRSLERAQRVIGFGVAVPGIVLGLGATVAFRAVIGWTLPPAPVIVVAAFVAVAVVHVLRDLPRTALGALDAVGSLDPGLREAPQALGARGWRVWQALHLPAMRPALISGAMTTFARSLTALSSVVLLADTHVPLLTVRMLVDIDAGRLAGASAMTVVAGALIGGVSWLLLRVGAAWQPAASARRHPVVP